MILFTHGQIAHRSNAMSTTDSWVSSLSSGNPVVCPFVELAIDFDKDKRPPIFGLTKERASRLQSTFGFYASSLCEHLSLPHNYHPELARVLGKNQDLLRQFIGPSSQDLNQLGEKLIPVGEGLIQGLAQLNDPELNQWLSRFALKFVRDFSKAGFDLKVTGWENVPLDGPVIIAANHRSHFDHWPLVGSFEDINAERVWIAGAPEIWLANPGPSFLFGKILHVIPYYREGEKARESFNRCVEILENGNLLVCYPGAGRADTDEIAFKRGVAVMAKKAANHCAIVPTYIGGTHELWPKYSPYPLGIGPVTVDFGKPIYSDGRQANDVTRELEAAVVALRDDNHRK